jgi:type VI secretion system protein ImpH
LSDRDDLAAEPRRFDLLRVLRDMERASPDKPRIGDSTTVAEDVVALSQDPFVDFPDANIDKVDTTAKGKQRLYTKYLGFFGPQGALPLNNTIEVMEWRDPAFPRFVDIFGNRFQQLFFRAWADARPIAQHDRPADDKFAGYLAAFEGLGTESMHGRDSVPDLAKLPFAGLVSSKVKSSRRLAQLLRGILHLDVWIEERVGTWLKFEPDARSALGGRGASLGVDSVLGSMAYSINDKFRIRIKARSLTEYQAILPGGVAARQIADLVFFYAGHRYEYDVQLLLPAHLAPPTQLGVSGQLGWTAWVAPPAGNDDGTYRDDARFDLSERRSANAL